MSSIRFINVFGKFYSICCWCVLDVVNWDAKKRMHLSYATSQAVSDGSMIECLETRKCTWLNVAWCVVYTSVK